MKITDKYLLSRFLKILAFALIAFTVVVIIVDLVENIDSFIDHKAPFGIVFLYYVYYTPFIIVLALPVAILLSTMFTVGSLARYHELEVMKATGLSLYRLALPILSAGFVISVITIIFTDVIMVPANYIKDELKQTRIEQRPASTGNIRQDVIKSGKDGWIVFARIYNESERAGEFVVVQKIENNQVRIAIKADQMAWADSGWILTDVSRRVFDQGNEVEFEISDTLFTSDLPQTPEVMSHLTKKPRDSRFFELLKTIRLKEWMGQDTAADRVELYLKFSFPFFNFIIIILGIPLAANPRRSGGSVGFGLSVIISFIYFVILRAGQSFGYNHKLSPLLAATIGNIIFFVIGLVMFFKARK